MRGNVAKFMTNVMNKNTVASQHVPKALRSSRYDASCPIQRARKKRITSYEEDARGNDYIDSLLL